VLTGRSGTKDCCRPQSDHPWEFGTGYAREPHADARETVSLFFERHVYRWKRAKGASAGVDP
jgi:hypothetical protein